MNTLRHNTPMSAAMRQFVRTAAVLLALTGRTAADDTSAGPNSADRSPAAQSEIWLCAGDRIMELLQPGAEWPFVKQHLSGIKLYIGQLHGKRLETREQTIERLRPLVRFVRAHDLQVAVELGGCLDFSPMDDTAGEWSAQHELAALANFYAAGGRVDYLDLDGPIRRLLHPENRREGRRFDSIDKAADELVDALKLHRAAHPETKYWLLTNFPNWGWRGDVSYHARGPQRQDYGDYDRVVRIVLEKLGAAEIRLDGVTVDNPYDYLVGEHFSVKLADPKSVDWLARVRSYEDFAREQGLTFNLIVNSQRGGQESDERFFRETLRMVDTYRRAGGRPTRWFVQSWYPHPKQMLPETAPPSMTALVKAVIERVRGEMLPPETAEKSQERGDGAPSPQEQAFQRRHLRRGDETQTPALEHVFLVPPAGRVALAGAKTANPLSPSSPPVTEATERKRVPDSPATQAELAKWDRADQYRSQTGPGGTEWDGQYRSFIQTSESAAAQFARAAAPSLGDAGASPKVSATNMGVGSLRSSPVTFGQPFRQGDFPQGVRVSAPGEALPAQVDVKRRYADGSLRFAVITAMLDELAPSQSLQLALSPATATAAPAATIAPSDLLKHGFDAVVTFRFPDGAVRTVSARKLLEREGRQARTWLQGRLATEWLLVGVPEDEQGKPDEDLSVRFQVRAYQGGESARVSVIVENCWDTWAGNIRYDVTVLIGGREVFRQAAVDHRSLCRWRKVFWWGREEPPVHVAHDFHYLTATGALPNYDRDLPSLPLSRPEDDAFMEGPQWDILGRGPLTAYMPTTGGRPEIAPYPLWTVRFLLTMEPRRRDFVLAAGDLAGSWPIHVRARATDRIMTIDQRPEFWLDERGQDRPHWKPPRHLPDAKQEKLSPDLAHQPSLAYVPYLVTGDHYYLEEAYFWANYCLLASWWHPREKSRGLLAGQIRGDAWALRNMGDAAWVATDGDPEQAYFEDKIRNNLAHRAAVMYGPPEFNRIGAWGLRTVEDARIQNPANPRWIITAPWEEDYLLWSLHHLVELGWHEAARPRDFLLLLRVGTLLHAPDFDPRLATPYRMVVGEKGPDGRPVVYDDWKVLGRENARLSEPDVPNYGNSYAYSARAALVCGVDGEFPGAREALAVLEGLLPGHREVMAREPFWAIVPRSASAMPPSAASVGFP